MTYSRGTIRVAAAAVLLVAVTSCADNNESPSPSESISSVPTTATTPSQTEAASTSASRLVRAYYAVRDELRQDPKASLGKLSSIATSTELSAQEKLFKRERKEGLHQVGATKIVELTVQSVSLDNSNPKTGKVPTAQVDVCYDVSQADLVNKEGKSVVAKSRANTGWIRYTVANYKWVSDPTGAWRVATSENLERTPCAAS